MKNKLTPSEYSKKWRKDNPEKVKKYAREYCDSHKEETRIRNKKARERILYNGLSEDVFERDNWTCQECGMSLEQSFILFNKRLCIHHFDGNGEESEITNNDLDNLTTLCQRCHGKLHRALQFKNQWGDLLDQDDSEWRFPKIRKLVNSKRNKNVNISQAKEIVAKELNSMYWTIDGYYYMKKANYVENNLNNFKNKKLTTTLN